ncbi:unnamed protein product [Gemmataceae bacterium]|nr:unnamed protein product [Gemmataceae bacterium]VTU01254.1 unnamed protein product [Gemmataceae bacterium]
MGGRVRCSWGVGRLRPDLQFDLERVGRDRRRSGVGALLLSPLHRGNERPHASQSVFQFRGRGVALVDDLTPDVFQSIQVGQ